MFVQQEWYHQKLHIITIIHYIYSGERNATFLLSTVGSQFIKVSSYVPILLSAIYLTHMQNSVELKHICFYYYRNKKALSPEIQFGKTAENACSLHRKYKINRFPHKIISAIKSCHNKWCMTCLLKYFTSFECGAEESSLGSQEGARRESERLRQTSTRLDVLF